MPSYTCTVCGRIGSKRRCAQHPVKRGPSSHITGHRNWRERIKPAVIARDHGICWLCHQPGADSVDHVTPVSKGGTNDMTNLRAAHLDCNQSKGNR
jgi:hypothetical protein